MGCHITIEMTGLICCFPNLFGCLVILKLTEVIVDIFGLFQRNKHNFLYLKLHLNDFCRCFFFSSLASDLEMLKTDELLSWYLHGCNY